MNAVKSRQPSSKDGYSNVKVIAVDALLDLVFQVSSYSHVQPCNYPAQNSCCDPGVAAT